MTRAILRALGAWARDKPDDIRMSVWSLQADIGGRLLLHFGPTGSLLFPYVENAPE